ncbi:MAG: rod shape-determining protein MreD [Gemmatimonadales bacterium]|nr:rod shape-determining protein MreD [Gemmatimonadales bacterium]
MRAFLRTTLIWAAIAFLGDTILGPAIAIKGIAPDFSVVALVILALAAGPRPATVGGFLIGLVQDLSSPSSLGLQAFCKCTLGYGLGSLRGRLVYGMPVVEFFMLVLAVLAHDLVFLLIQARFGPESFLGTFFLRSAPVALYTGIVGLPILRLVEFLGILRPED